VRHADELFAAGNWQEAAAAYAALPPEAGRWRAYGSWRAAAIYRDALHDVTRAEEAFVECASRHGGDEWGYACQVDLADLLRDAGQPRPAIGAYRTALQLRPNGSYASHCLLETGRGYLLLGEPEQARVEWEELLERFGDGPLAPTVALEVARSYDLQGDPKSALAAYRAVIAGWPEHSLVALAAFGEGEALEQLGRLDEAVAAFERTLLIHPNPAAVRIKLVAAQERQGRRSQEESKVMDHGMMLNPD
jgi:tetratricopeptide (TPR) repeat protein